MSSTTVDTAILLVNLGTTNAPTVPALRRFLREFLSDRRVIDVPRYIWYPILYAFVLPFRPRKILPFYKAVWLTDTSDKVEGQQLSGSPVAVYTKRLALKVQQRLGAKGIANTVVTHAMCYGDDSIRQMLESLHTAHPALRQVVVLPLFPQYTSTTSASIFDGVFNFYTDPKRRCVPELRTIRDYAENPTYIAAVGRCMIDAIMKYFSTSATAAGTDAPKKWKEVFMEELDRLSILLSYHSIPVRYVEEGDDYPERCKATTAAITAFLAAELRVDMSDIVIHVYQSQFGSMPWIGPKVDEAVAVLPLAAPDERKAKFAAALGNPTFATKKVDLCFAMTPGFSADCVETVHEVGMEAKEEFIEHGGKDLVFVPCLNDSDLHVDVVLSVLDA